MILESHDIRVTNEYILKSLCIISKNKNNTYQNNLNCVRFLCCIELHGA